MPDTSPGIDFLDALSQAHERVHDAHNRYAFTRGLLNQVVVDDVEGETEEEKAKRIKKLQKQALKDGKVLTGFVDKDDEKRMAEIIAKAVSDGVTTALEADAKKVDPNKRPDVVAGGEVGDDARSQLPANLKGFVPGGLRGHSVEVDTLVDEHVAKALVKQININKFPRDMDAKDFSMARYCMAVENFPYKGESAYTRMAPKEHAYYEALASYGKEYKALGEYVSG
jgi:hypothetical protein